MEATLSMLTGLWASLCRRDDRLSIRPALEAKLAELGGRGIRAVAVGRREESEGRWRLLGLLTFTDPLRPDARATLEDCRSPNPRWAPYL